MPVGGNFTNCNCGPETSACESPTEPLATVGLCLADGSPIAATVVRDCAGVVTSEGWLDLATGAWSAGPPPVGTVACGDSRSIQVSGTFCDIAPDSGDVLGLVLVEYSYAADGSIDGVRLVDAVTGETYTPTGTVTTCPAGVEQPERDLTQLCDINDDESGTVQALPFLRDFSRSENGAITGHMDYTLDGTPYTPTGTVGLCFQPVTEPCRDTATLLLCDEASDLAWNQISVDADPDSPAGQGWLFRLSPEGDPSTIATVRVTTSTPDTGSCASNGPRWYNSGTVFVYELDQVAQTFPTLRVNILDFDTGETLTMLNGSPDRLEGNAYTTGGGVIRSNENNATGYLLFDGPPATFSYRFNGSCTNLAFDAVSARTTQFLRRIVTDCDTGETVSVTDTTLDGQPYEPTGEVGQCVTAGGECCEEPPELRMDVEAATLCVREQTTGDILGQVVVERVYDDQSGDLLEQRLTALDGAPYEVPAGAELVTCPTPDRIVRTICLAREGEADFRTNPANTAAGQDEAWEWSTSPDGPWYPMYDVQPLAAWQVTDTDTEGPAHWVAPHSDRTVCPPAGEASPPVPATWYTRARWTLPPDVSPETIRISASVLNADNWIDQWRLNDGAWQPVNSTATQFIPPAYKIPPTQVPGARPGENQVVVQVHESAPATSCPSINQAGLLLHVTATYRHDPETWTQVIETSGAVYYLDQDGQRQDAIPDGHLQVPCAGGGDAGCCPPEARTDIESDVLCIRTADGETTNQVLVERVYDDQSGARTEQRLTDLTTGEEVDLPDGAELVLCQEPACPVAFATECVGAVTRTEAGYDNTSMIGGLPGKCGSVQGPGGQFPCQPTTGPLTITSWIVNGEEVLGEGSGRAFNGGPCGPGSAATPGMHRNWALALTNLDPSGANWSAQEAPGCAWFVGSTGGTQTAYGAMTVQDAAGQQWILGPAQACEEVQYTKVYTQECDGTVSVSWLDAQGVATDAPDGDLVPCGTGCGSGGGAGLDVETVALCDVQADGTVVPFLRHITYGTGGQVSVVLDTGLDAYSPYVPSGTVGVCQPREDGQDVELLAMCVIDNATGGTVQRILAEVRYDAETGERTGVSYVDPSTWGPVALPGGTHIGLCPEAEPEPDPDVELLTLCDVAEDAEPVPFLRHLVYQPGAAAPTVVDTALDGVTSYTPLGGVGVCERREPVTVLEECRCDDSDGDGVGDTPYVELIAVYEDGTLQTVGTYAEDLSGPFEPVSPVPCDQDTEGAEEVRTVQAHRVQLTPGASWSAAWVPTLQSVTLTAHGGTGTITADGEESTLHEGESVSWSVTREGDAILVGPLLVTAATGTVTVAYTRTVTP